MSDMLSIASSGLRAYQTALNVVGENIANATTKGYVRRDVRLQEVQAGIGGFSLQINGQTTGGVEAPGVDRQWDTFRAASYRNSSAEAGRTGAAITWLQQIENTLNAAGIGAVMTKFFNAGTAIASDPTSSAPRAAMLDAAQGVASAFTIAGQSFSAAASDLKASAALSVTRLNGLTAALAEANAGLVKTRQGGNDQAQLLDQRDQLLDQISAIASISVETDQVGAATVRLNDTNGAVLVAGRSTRTLGAAFNSSGMMALTLGALDGAGNTEAVSLRGGSLAGLGDASVRIADMRAQLANLASDLATGVNAVQAAGVDLDGQPGAALFDATAGDGALAVNTLSIRQVAAARPWTVSSTSAGTLSASTAPSAAPLASTRFTLNNGVLSALDPVTSNVIASAAYTPGAPVTLAGLSVTVSGPVANGDSFTVKATAANSRDNGNLDALAALRASGKFEMTASDLVSSNASALSAKKQVADAQGAILEGATAARDAVSGVNLDNEAVELMRFQQAYQASSRVIQASREIFQSILDVI